MAKLILIKSAALLATASMANFAIAVSLPHSSISLGKIDPGVATYHAKYSQTSAQPATYSAFPALQSLTARTLQASNKPVTEADLRENIDTLNKDIGSMLRPAYEIAMEKGLDLSKLKEIERQRAAGLQAAEDNKLIMAIKILEDTNYVLQQSVATMRSGDSLTVALPEDGTKAAWLDSERRYKDWLAIANWLMQQAVELKLDINKLDAAKHQAEAHFKDALTAAEQKNWSKANELADKAYQIMEIAWREQGLDV